MLLFAKGNSYSGHLLDRGRLLERGVLYNFYIVEGMFIWKWAFIRSFTVIYLDDNINLCFLYAFLIHFGCTLEKYFVKIFSDIFNVLTPFAPSLTVFFVLPAVC